MIKPFKFYLREILSFYLPYEINILAIKKLLLYFVINKSCCINI